VRRLLETDGCFGRIAASIGGAKARPVRVLAFDKTTESNWSLGWHQDRVIAVKHRRDMLGFGTWTLKGGIPHVEAPLEILREMFSLRLHLDDCGPDNGALKVLPGSWRLGRVTDSEVRQASATMEIAICEARTGDLVAMKALTVHASDAARHPSHRRVLHVDYCGTALPQGLEWALDA
jgi:ectoine hydroxylase-related dioxygenase (phytanoyl-CoA dioxygenase family)